MSSDGISLNVNVTWGSLTVVKDPYVPLDSIPVFGINSRIVDVGGYGDWLNNYFSTGWRNLASICKNE